MSETNNSNITTGVSMAVSTDMTKKYTGISTRDLAADASEEIVNHRNTLNLDKRTIARPILDPELVFYEVIASRSPEFLDVCQAITNAFFAETRHADRSNILISCNSAYWGEIQFLGLAQLENTNIQWNLVNDHSLYIYENFVRDKYEITRNHPYNVLSYDEIGPDMTNGEKFSLISITAIDVFHNPKLLNKLIGSLRHGGYLVLKNAGDSKRLYSNGFVNQPFWEMHKKLLSQNGYVYHSPIGIGSTIFVKE